MFIGLSKAKPQKSKKSSVLGGMSPLSSVSGSELLPSENVDTASESVTMFAKPVTMGVVEGYVPDSDTTTYRKLARDMHRYDAIVGSGIDILTSMAFDDFEIGGTQKDWIQPYLDSLDRLSIKALLPAMATDYLVEGAHANILSIDKEAKVYDNAMPLDLDNLEIVPNPIFGLQPLVKVTWPEHVKNFFKVKDPQVESILKILPPVMQHSLKGGSASYAINNENLLFIPRRLKSTHYLGVSLLDRLLPVWMYEKALLRGTIEMSYRRQRAFIHLVLGEPGEWDPTPEDFQTISSMFAQADQDPRGMVIATRTGVSTNEIQQGGEFWRWEIDNFATAKFRAMGISDNLLTGEGSAEAVAGGMTILMKNSRDFRNRITRDVFLNRIFLNVAVLNDHKKEKSDTSSTIRHRFNEAEIDASEYVIPRVIWHDSLRMGTAADYLDMLDKLAAKGVPIPMRMWVGGSGISLDDILNGASDDVAVREKLKTYTDSIKKFLPSDPNDPNAQQDFSKVITSVGGLDLASAHRKPIADRDWGDLAERLQMAEYGGKKHIRTANERRNLDHRANVNIVKHLKETGKLK